MNPVIIIDPGHGMSNRRAGRYDPGACAFGDTEAAIVMEWANVLRGILRARGFAVVRTRVDRNDPAPIGRRASIARQYNGSFMLSLHCNAANGRARGTECFYRGAENKATAARFSAAIAGHLNTTDRGAKTESSSQHSRLAVMSFQPCFLLEMAFIDNAADHAALTEDPDTIRRACESLADIIVESVTR